jgi:hypothetical protein
MENLTNLFLRHCEHIFVRIGNIPLLWCCLFRSLFRFAFMCIRLEESRFLQGFCNNVTKKKNKLHHAIRLYKIKQ